MSVYTPEELQFGEGAIRIFEDQGIILRCKCKRKITTEDRPLIRRSAGDDLGLTLSKDKKSFEYVTFGTRDDAKKKIETIEKKLPCKCELKEEITIETA